MGGGGGGGRHCVDEIFRCVTVLCHMSETVAFCVMHVLCCLQLHSPVWNMNARIFICCERECLLTQTWPWLILSYEREGLTGLAAPLNDRYQVTGKGPPRWPSGQGVRLESGRSRVRIPLIPRFFSGVESNQ